VLKQAFNAILRLHSRAATLKRLGTVDTFTPIRITQSNYFRFLAGPESTTIRGKEFIIPVDSILGQFAQLLTWSGVPTSGTYKIQYGASLTTDLQYNASAATIQTALRLLSGLSNCLVTGDYTSGFVVTFVGFQTAPALGSVVNSTLDKTCVFSNTYSTWSGEIKKGDRIIDGTKLWAVDEIIDMQDLGGVTMGWRCRGE
jgi:hypothetical protein